MKLRTMRRALGRTAVLGLASALLVVQAASPAAADTANATANALLVTGVVNADTGTCTAASSAGTGACTAGTAASNLTSLIAASALTQSATASASGGNSAACAGLSGPGGGVITVGPSGQCQPPSNPMAGGVVLLGGIVTANAVYATCGSSNGTTPTGSSSPVTINPTGGPLGGLLGLLGTVAPSPASTSTHIILSLTPLLGLTPAVDLLTIDLNAQTSSGTPPVLTVTALEIKVLSGLTTLPGVGALLNITGGSVADVRIGRVTCGPNSVQPLIPAIPLKGAPIAIAIFLVSGFVAWRFWWSPRQHRSRTTGA